MSEMGQLRDLLRPGIYVLRLRGRVVWVGEAKKPLVRIYAHSQQRRGDTLAAFLPSRPVEFDDIQLFPCRVENLGAELQRIRAELGWAPPEPRVVAHPIDWTRVAANG